MSYPRIIIPGETHFITRRTSQRQFRLRPHPVVNQVFLYALAYAREQTEIKLHAWLAMANHFHLILTDPDGSLPEFMHRMDMLIDRALNQYDVSFENFFAPGSYNDIRLFTAHDVLEKIAYTYTNPVRAALVRSIESYPGAHGLFAPLDKELWIPRPHLFSENGVLPPQAALVHTKSLHFENIENDVYRAIVLHHVEEEQETARVENARLNRPYLGKKRCLLVNPFDNPKSDGNYGKLRPNIAAKDRQLRNRLLAELKRFRREYKEALDQYRGGDHDTEFPFGTYWMRVFLGVRVRAPT